MLLKFDHYFIMYTITMCFCVFKINALYRNTSKHVINYYIYRTHYIYIHLYYIIYRLTYIGCVYIITNYVYTVYDIPIHNIHISSPAGIFN